MGKKGELTRQRVIERAAPVFNQRGYWGASLREVMTATGLEKGGIYNHFGSKDELAAAALDHNVDVIRQEIRDALAGRRHAVDRLHAVLDVYRTFVAKPPFPGGCPILNAAVDSDDTHATLRRRARKAATELHDDTYARIIERGVERRELKRDTDPQTMATVFTATIEGALMLSQLHRDPSFVYRAADYLDGVIASMAEPEEDA